MGFQMSDFEFQTFFFVTPTPLFWKNSQNFLFFNYDASPKYINDQNQEMRSLAFKLILKVHLYTVLRMRKFK